MAVGDQYLVAAGFVQKFGDKPAVNERDVNGQTVRDVTIKNTNQRLIRITVWPELAGVELGEGYWVAAEGKYSASGDQGQFHNISAIRCVSQAGGVRAAREVANAVAPDASAPAAQASSTDPPPF